MLFRSPWNASLTNATIRELPIGDSMSQMHDLLLHTNGMVYVGDNLQDRLYEVNPQTGAYTVYRVPPQPGDNLGGLLAGRLKDFPRHETYQGIHSLAESPKDGHIFITPSYQRRLIEFDPKTKAFTYHDMDGGFYPHTIRVDLKRLDALVNLIGELVIDRTRFVHVEEELRQHHAQLPLTGNMTETLQLFGRHMNEIQDIIMKVRMVPIGNAFNKFTRIVRDLSRQLGKEIDLHIDGEETELDKTLVEQIGDPLIHLIRNSCDHGVELPEGHSLRRHAPRRFRHRDRARLRRHPHRGGKLWLRECPETG